MIPFSCYNLWLQAASGPGLYGYGPEVITLSTQSCAPFGGKCGTVSVDTEAPLTLLGDNSRLRISMVDDRVGLR